MTLTAKLAHMGFEINPYDRFVANKMIHGNQCTILWHVDDIRVSQCSKGVTSLMNELGKGYGKDAPFTLSLHVYL